MYAMQHLTASQTTALIKDDSFCCNVAEIEVYAMPEAAPPEPVIGDVNRDDAVDVADVIALQKYLLGFPEAISPDTSDLDGDGMIDIFDLGLLKRALLA